MGHTFARTPPAVLVARRAASLGLAGLLTTGALAACGRHEPTHRFSITVPSETRSEALTGRVYIAISPDSAPEPRFAVGSLGAYFSSTPFFGLDVDHLAPGQAAVITDTSPGYPKLSLRGLPAGDYYVQALANVYTEAHRSDGHTIWVHFDNWEGQHASSSPGNLTSAVQRIHFDPDQDLDITLPLTRVIPPLSDPPDTKWIKHVKFQSALLSKFWGHPIYLGAAVLLPQGYDEHPM